MVCDWIRYYSCYFSTHFTKCTYRRTKTTYKEQRIENPTTHKNNKYPTDDIIINYDNGEVVASNGQYQFEIKQRPPEKVNGDPFVVITREHQKS